MSGKGWRTSSVIWKKIQDKKSVPNTYNLKAKNEKPACKILCVGSKIKNMKIQ